MAAGSCRKKPWPPSNISSRAPGMERARNSLLDGGAMPSKRPPHTRVGLVMAPSLLDVSCPARASNWFVRPCGGVSSPPGDPSSPMRWPNICTSAGLARRQGSSQRVSMSSMRFAARSSGGRLTRSCSG